MTSIPASHQTQATAAEKAERWRKVSGEAMAKAKVNAALKAAEKLALYRDMVRIRCFEQGSLLAYQQGKIGGFLHLYEGQEAIAVGSVSLLGKDDHSITAYRDHGHALAVGMDMKACMAEMFGKATGCSKGKGGSMHFFDPSKNYWGGHGIVGGQIPLGTGIAFALKYRGLKGCCLAFMGDGAVNQGAVHEAFNLAALWALPVVFVIENNFYSMGTSQERSSAYGACLAERAEAYGMDWATVNGHVLYDVRAGFDEAMQRAKEQQGPTVLEVFTYRYRGHSIADANHEKYRSAEEVATYKKEHDPIQLYGQLLEAEGVLEGEQAKQIELEARTEVKAAAKFADESPFPKPEAIFEDIYWEEDNPEKAQARQGRMIFEHGGILKR